MLIWDHLECDIHATNVGFTNVLRPDCAKPTLEHWKMLGSTHKDEPCRTHCREWPWQMVIRVASLAKCVEPTSQGCHGGQLWSHVLWCVLVNLWNGRPTDGAGTKRAKRVQLLAACRILTAATMLEVPLRVFAVWAARITEMKHVKSDGLIHWTPRGWLFVSSVVRKYDVSLQVTTVSHVNDWQLELPTPKWRSFGPRST